MIKKILNFKFVISNYNKEFTRCRGGMTYIELVVVLSIFSILSTVVLFNYQEFQEKVEIKNLANQIALKIFDAQNAAISGRLPLNPPNPWKPSYGVYFDMSSDQSKKIFYSFIDLNKSDSFYPISCPGSECLEKNEIKNKNSIKSIKVFYKDIVNPTTVINKDLQIIFVRPSLSANIISTENIILPDIDYVEIIVFSPSSESIIKVYPSGRIQVD